jgi:hypothetical protein
LKPAGAVAGAIFSDGGTVVVLVLVVVAAVGGTLTVGMCTELPHAAAATATPTITTKRRTSADATPSP